MDTPYENKLLNGLRLLVWQQPTAEKTTIKLRIHSGAAFDPKDKMGTMALLAEILFPTEQSRDYFREDLNGSIDIATNYDFIQITVTGKSDEVLSMIETIANAVVNPQITPENFKLVQTARLIKVADLENKPSYLAEQTTAKRLLSDFPYGRPLEGTSESLKKIDYADLIFAKQRFLTADNATLVIEGKIKADFAYRATRQLFGNWTKSDKKVPATFAMPQDPDLNTQIINFEPKGEVFAILGEVRLATRGVARNDKDYWAMRFLADILEDRFREKLKSEKGREVEVSVTHQRSLLPGLLNIRFSPTPAAWKALVATSNSAKPPTKFQLSPVELLKDPITAAEFEKTRVKTLAEIDQKPLTEKTLDVETFRLISVADEMKKLNAVTQTDVQKVLERIAKQSFVSVLLPSN